MIKHSIAPLIIILTGAFQCYGQPLVTDSIAKRMWVKTVVKSTFFGDSKSPAMRYTELYDTSGFLAQRISFNNNLTQVSGNELFVYNKQHQLIAVKSIYINENDPDTSIQRFTYNTQGQIDRNTFGSIEYSYDPEGRVVQKIEKTAKPGMLTTDFGYDPEGNLEFEECNFGRYPRHRIDWIYNDKHQLVKAITSHFSTEESTWKPHQENTFVYDKNGLVITEYQKEESEDVMVQTCTYSYVYTFRNETGAAKP